MSDESSFDLRTAVPGDIIEVICGDRVFYITITYLTNAKREGNADRTICLMITCSDPDANVGPFGICSIPTVLFVDSSLQIADTSSGPYRRHQLIREIKHNGVSITSPEFAAAALH